MSDIIFINPCFDYPVTRKNKIPVYNRIWPPLSLANCASILENKGYDVDIIDANAERLSIKETIKRAEKGKKVFITTSSLDRWQCPNFNIEVPLKLSRRLSEKREVYLMGYHGTVKPKEILKLSKADEVLIGEPESNIISILKEPEKAKSFAYKRNGDFAIHNQKETVNLNKIPLPAFHLLPMDKYLYEILGENFALLETSRGCPWNCIFCNKVMYPSRLKKKSLSKVKKEIEYVIERFGVKSLYFIDLEFTVNKNLVRKICDFLIEKNYDLKWTCQTRLDTVNKDLLDKMKQAGCEIIHYGVESGSKRILNWTEKNINFKDVKKGIRITKESGIKAVCFFMLGFPGETEREMDKTIEFAKELNPEYASFNVAKPYIGTKYFESIKEDINKDEIFPIYYNKQFSKEFLEKRVKEAYKRFYFRGSYIFPNVFRNPKMLWKQFKIFLNYVFY